MNSDLLDASDAVGSADPLSGEVKWFDVKKGFGFIVAPDGRDVFVHFSSILGDGFRSLKDGEVVQYEITHGDKGLHAKNVRRGERPTPAQSTPVHSTPALSGHDSTAGRTLAGQFPAGGQPTGLADQDSMQRAAQRTRSPDATGQAAGQAAE